MTIAKLISYCIAIAMTVVIFWAQSQVSILDSPIPELPWGVVSLVDLYAGFTLFGLWIIYKESLLKSFFLDCRTYGLRKPNNSYLCYL
jgi:hypothetical protein